MVQRKCLSDSELQQLIQSPTAASHQRELEAHLESCDTCRRRLDELAGSVKIPSGFGCETGRLASHALTEAIAKLRNATPSSSAPIDPEAGSPRYPFLAPASQPAHLGQLGKYQILNVIGEGGMGVVFAAIDPTLHRDVAIKVPARSLVATQDAHDRFMREARAIASVKHDNIVTVHAVEEQNETLYLVMELINGQSLAQRIERERRLPWDEVARIGFETSAALIAAHARGLVHRDIKPGNILLERGSGRVKVTDFGLAKSRVDTSLTDTGVLAGTPEFMSPEQANDEEVTEQSDFFSLGAVLYAACSGKSPFRGQTAMTTLRRVSQDNVRSLHELDSAIPVWFSDLVQRLISKSPSDRPAASELIQLWSHHQSEMSRAPSHLYNSADSSQAPSTRARRATVLAAAATVIIVGLIAFVARPGDKGATHPPETGFVVNGITEQFSSLAQAVAAANEKGVIEVHGNGPFLVPSLDTGSKALVIRATPGSSPVFMSLNAAERSQQPFLTAESDIHLQGIEVRWTIQGNGALKGDEVAGRCIIDVSGGHLKLEECRLIAGRMNGCLSVSDGSLELVNCHLISTRGPCCRWVPGDRSKLTASNCVFQGRVGILFNGSSQLSSTPMSFHLTQNSFATFRAFHLIMDRPMRQIDFSSSRNAFDSHELLTLMPARRPLAGSRLAAGQIRRAIISHTTWTESHNAYRPGMAFLARSAGGNREALVSSLDDWRFMWPQGVSQSIEVEFEKTSSADARQPDHLAEIRVPSSAEQPLGADLTSVGPGATRRDD